MLRFYKGNGSQLHRLASLRSVGQVGRLETQPRGELSAVLRQAFFLGNLFLLLKPSNDWMRPTHTIKSNVLYLKSANWRCEAHLQNTLTAIPGLGAITYLGPIASQSGPLKLNHMD